MERTGPLGRLKTKMKPAFFYLILFLFLVSCNGNKGNESTAKQPDVKVDVPTFNRDSAYYFVQKQVDFGPRVPNTEAHIACGNWLEDKLRLYADRIFLQEDQVIAYDGRKLNMKNIIASFNPDNKKRIILCAHWDTRPYADQDEDPSRHREPILGANDGGSGVGTLLEIARQLREHSVGLGVDIILFDVEDYGQPEFSDLPPKADTYGLGSQYWAKRPHQPGYKAKYGILLDMVGGKNSKFYMEGYSRKFAPSLVRKVWSNGAQLGYSSLFIFKESRQVIDDHYYLNLNAGIPTIDIINLDIDRPLLFGDFWHTHSDNMDLIDPFVLKAVGQTVLQVVYKENAGVL